MIKKIISAAPTTKRHVVEVVDKMTGDILEIQSKTPSPGDRVLIKHDRALKIGIQTEEGNAVRLRKTGRKVKRYVRVGVIK